MAQQDDAWFESRRGRITGSKFDVIMNGTERAKETYMNELIDQLGGAEIKRFRSKACDWGNNNEARAVAAYKLKTGAKLAHIDFILDKDKNYCGCSPDGLVDEDGGIEVKCPYNPINHEKTLIAGMPKKHMAQCQGLMLVTGR